tara:strand:+ start:84 stop:464 length:381 start_codon:yes stop_codon:yes gene_type:complete
MTDSSFDKDVAELVIRPKLQQVYRNNPATQSKSELRQMFIEQEGYPISAAKFDEYLKMLNITFKKQVIIEGLFVGGNVTFSAASPRPQDGDDSSEEEVVFDNEDPIPPNGIDPRTGRNRSDMFGLA